MRGRAVPRREAVDQPGAPAPVRRLFGKEAEMPKRGRAGDEAQPVIAHRPLRRQCFGQRPAAPFLLVVTPAGAGDETPVRGLPDIAAEARRPHRLRFRPHEAVAPEALQLLAVAAVEEFVVGPVVGAQQMRLWLGNQAVGHTRTMPPTPAEIKPDSVGIFRHCAKIFCLRRF